MYTSNLLTWVVILYLFLVIQCFFIGTSAFWTNALESFLKDRNASLCYFLFFLKKHWILTEDLKLICPISLYFIPLIMSSRVTYLEQMFHYVQETQYHQTMKYNGFLRKKLCLWDTKLLNIFLYFIHHHFWDNKAVCMSLYK